jgi:hypothetical protein
MAGRSVDSGVAIMPLIQAGVAFPRRKDVLLVQDVHATPLKIALHPSESHPMRHASLPSPSLIMKPPQLA